MFLQLLEHHGKSQENPRQLCGTRQAEKWDYEYGANPIEWSTSLTFLNPGYLSPRELWSPYMSRDGLVDEQTIQYSACAIIGWPLSRDLENSMTLIGEGAAVKVVLADKPVKSSMLQKLMEMAIGKEKDQDNSLDASISPYMEFCQDLCEAIASVGDVALVSQFFTKFFEQLKNKEQLGSSLAGLVKVFGWDAVRAHLEKCMEMQDEHQAMALAVALADGCTSDISSAALAAHFAVQKAQLVSSNELSLSKHLGALWTCAASCPDKAVFAKVTDLLKQLNGSHLRPVVDSIAKYVDKD